jgi:putative acetyltransferase
MQPPAKLRTCTPADAPALAAIYREAVLTLGLQAYTPQQTEVWAEHVADLDCFSAPLAGGITLCVEIDQQPVAFGQLHPVNHVAYLYCSSAHARCGSATAILNALEEHARAANVDRLHVEASRVARPCFERNGYQVLEEERVVRDAIEFVRYKMEKLLGR